ncbi:MAG: hypothetical protein WBA74_02195 [Cyclobacteriaceae bacterium]
MDREGFNLINDQYQKEVADQKQEITKKWMDHFEAKKYVLSEDQNTKHKEEDLKNCQKNIEEELVPIQKRIHDFHFPDKIRDEILAEIKKAECAEHIMKESQKEFTRKSDHGIER